MYKVLLIGLVFGMSQISMANNNLPDLPRGSTHAEIKAACRAAYPVLKAELRRTTRLGHERRMARRTWRSFRKNCVTLVRGELEKSTFEIASE